MSIKRTKTVGSKQMRAVTTETKIKRALTRLQKLVQQYYEENPDTTDNCDGDKDTINYYGSAVFGTSYNEYNGKWQTIANITIKGKGDGHIEIESPINHKPINHKPIK